MISLNVQAKEQVISIAYGLENYNFTALFARFTEETGIKVFDASFKNNELKAELLQRSNIDKLPDVVIVPSDFIGLEEIDFSEVPDTLLSKRLTEKAKSSVQIGDKYFAVPIVSGNHLLLYYNKAVIKSPADSWQKLQEQQAQLAANIDLIAWSYYEMYWFIPFLGAFQEFPYVNGQLNFKTAGMEKALVWYHQLAIDGIVDKNCDYKCSVDKFTNNQLAYTINGTWALNLFMNKLGDNLGVALLPSYENKPMSPYFSSHVIAFPAKGLTGDNAEALKMFAQFFQRKDIQQAMWESMRSIPTHKEILNDITLSEKGNIQIILKQLDLSVPLPNERNMAIVWEAMLKGMNRYQGGLFDAKKATEYMHYIAGKSIDHVEQQ
ncbi:extracellular solute-binding protein [Colwelliaceae bacterium 6471]